MKPRQRVRQSLVVSRKAAKARRPPERALDDPPSRKQHEPALGWRQLHNLEGDPVLGGVLARLLARISLIDEGEFDRVARDLLHALAQLSHLRSVLLACGRD